MILYKKLSSADMKEKQWKNEMKKKIATLTFCLY